MFKINAKDIEKYVIYLCINSLMCVICVSYLIYVFISVSLAYIPSDNQLTKTILNLIEIERQTSCGSRPLGILFM